MTKHCTSAWIQSFESCLKMRLAFPPPLSPQTVREEEKELYRQLLQMVIGKNITSKPSSLFSLQLWVLEMHYLLTSIATFTVSFWKLWSVVSFFRPRCASASLNFVQEPENKSGKPAEVYSLVPDNPPPEAARTQEQHSHNSLPHPLGRFPSQLSFEPKDSSTPIRQNNTPSLDVQPEGKNHRCDLNDVISLAPLSVPPHDKVVWCPPHFSNEKFAPQTRCCWCVSRSWFQCGLIPNKLAQV